MVYLEDLMTDVLNLHPELVEPFLYQWLSEGNIKTRRWQDKLYDYLVTNFKGKALVEKTMEGITLKEMGGASAYSLQDLIAPADDLIVDPCPISTSPATPSLLWAPACSCTRCVSPPAAVRPSTRITSLSIIPTSRA